MVVLDSRQHDSQEATNQQQQFEQNVQNMFGINNQQQQQQQQANLNDNNVPFGALNDHALGSPYYNHYSSSGGGSTSSAGYDPFSVTSNYVKDVNTSAFLTALYANIVIFIILITCYEIFRRILPTVYSPRSTPSGDSSSIGRTNSSRISSSSSVPAVNVNTRLFLGWIPGVIRASWSVVRSVGGLDSYMFLRYVRLCFQITFASALWGMIILWPVYATGNGGAAGWYFLSMANIEQGSHRLWAPAIFLWLQTLYVFFLLNEEYKHYLECRVDFLARGEGTVLNQQHMYSLIVERIPHELRSDEALYEYFNRLFPRKVHSTAVVLNLPDLERECTKRKRVLRRLEKGMISLDVRGRRPRHVVGRKRLRCCGVESSPIIVSCGGGGRNVIVATAEGGDNDSDSMNPDRLPQRGEYVDSISYYRRELGVMNTRVARMQHEKKRLAQTGNDSVRASQWISHAMDRVSTVAESTLRPSRGVDDDGLITGFGSSSTRRKPLLLTILDRMGVDFISGAISYVQHNIDEVVDSVVGATMSSTGFVTFNDLSTLAHALKTPLYHKPDVLVVKMAPEPRDVKWDNAHVNLGWSKGREFSANILFGIGALFWSIPVASIQALATADQIATVPGMAWVATLYGGDVAAFVNGYLPIILLLWLISILPHIFYGVALHYEDRKTESDVQKSIIGRFFYYQLANIFITVTAGSILDSLGEIVEHPSNMLSILGKSLPNVVGYFATFLMTKIFAGLPMICLRFGPLFRLLFLKICFRVKYLTEAEIHEVYYPQEFSQLRFGWEYPNLLLVIVICFVYSCISPIILPVGAIFFAGSWLLYKNQILLVFSPTYESGGVMFEMAVHRTMIGLVCGQLTLIGYCIIRGGFYQALFMFPLPLITVKMMSVFKLLYVNPSKCISVEKAVELDAKRNIQSTFSSDVYRQPVLTEPETSVLRGFAPATGDIEITDTGKIV